MSQVHKHLFFHQRGFGSRWDNSRIENILNIGSTSPPAANVHNNIRIDINQHAFTYAITI